MYQILFWIYLFLAAATFLPIILAGFGKVELNPGGDSFDSCIHFSAPCKQRLSAHYSRLAGTLGFWKNRAEYYKRFHYYCVFWTIFSSWAVPILGALMSVSPDSSGFHKYVIVLVSGHVALSLSFHKGLKVADNMKAFRHGESEFYDLYRRMLDRPKTLGATEEEQVDKYLLEVEQIRRIVRNAETDSLPAIDKAKVAE